MEEYGVTEIKGVGKVRKQVEVSEGERYREPHDCIAELETVCNPHLIVQMNPLPTLTLFSIQVTLQSGTSMVSAELVTLWSQTLSLSSSFVSLFRTMSGAISFDWGSQSGKQLPFKQTRITLLVCCGSVAILSDGKPVLNHNYLLFPSNIALCTYSAHTNLCDLDCRQWKQKKCFFLFFKAVSPLSLK